MKARRPNKTSVCHQQVDELRERLAEVEETLRAIQEGEVDAVVVCGRNGPNIYSLTSAETSYRLIVETMKEAALTVALDGRILYSNAQFGEIIGLPLEKIMGHPLREFLTPEDVAAAGALLDRTRRRPVKQRLVFCGTHGNTIPVNVSAHLLDQSDAPTICLVAADLTELEASAEKLRSTIAQLQVEVDRRKMAETALRHRSQQLRMLASQLTLVEQRDRRRMATVLHDELQQLLVGARFRLSHLERASKSELHQVAVEAAGLIDQAVECSRSLTAELNPPSLQHGGLVAELEWLVIWLRRKYSLIVELHADETAEVPSEDMAVLLFQSVRELLFNTVKYAKVKQAKVQVQRKGHHIEVTVSDQGIGFDPNAIALTLGQSTGFGLFSIRERLELMGGQMLIDSAVGEGSRITLRVPGDLPGKPLVREPSNIPVAYKSRTNIGNSSESRG
jgi:PAS domain S-box-containing protein